MDKDFKRFEEKYKYFFDRGISMDLFSGIGDNYNLLEQRLFEILKSLVDNNNYYIVLGYINTEIIVDTSLKTLINVSLFLDQINTDNVDKLVGKLLNNDKIKTIIEQNKNNNIDSNFSDSLCLFFDPLEESINKLNTDIYYEEDALKSYLKEISRIPVLTREEEQDLFRRYRNGDESIKPHLIKSNLKLVVGIAKRFVRPDNATYFLDFIQDGNLGLVTAIEKFDPELGFKFSTYATWWIRRAIKVSIYKNCSSIMTTKNLDSLGYKIRKFIDDYYEKYNKNPDYETISEALNININTLISFLQVKKGVLSLNQHVSDDDDTELATNIVDEGKTPEEAAISTIESEEILRAMETLSPRERAIIIRRFGFVDNNTETLEAIADDIEMTRERVRQIELKALKKLRLALWKINSGEYSKDDSEWSLIYNEFKEYPEPRVERALSKVPLRYKRAIVNKLCRSQNRLTKKDETLYKEAMYLVKHILSGFSNEKSMDEIKSALTGNVEFLTEELCQIIIIMKKCHYIGIAGIAAVMEGDPAQIREIINALSDDDIQTIEDTFGIKLKALALTAKEKKLQKN